jgi:hypothetical protein
LFVPADVVVVVVTVDGIEADRVGDRAFRDASNRGPTSRSGKVMKNKQPKVVPKKAPSTEWNRLFGGVYRSWQLGQKSFTVS